MDRPRQGHRHLSREYVQPQWVYDCANHRVLAAAALYAPGRALPPHLSPFVSGEEEGYVPEYGRQLAALQEAARAARRRHAAAAAGGEVFVGEAAGGGAGEEGGVAGVEAEEEAVEARYAAELAKELQVGGGVVPWGACWLRVACCPARPTPLLFPLKHRRLVAPAARRRRVRRRPPPFPGASVVPRRRLGLTRRP